MIPYTYLLKHEATGKYYYGVRYAADCDPADLWVTYFTSSPGVQKLIKESGTEGWTMEIRRTFSTAAQALSWEGRVLRRIRARQRSDFINKHNNDGLVALVGDANPMRNPDILAKWKASPRAKRGPQTAEHIEARRQALTGRKRSDAERAAISAGRLGKVKMSEEQRRHMSEINRGKVMSEASSAKKSQAIAGRKRYTDGNSIRMFHPGTEPAGWVRT
jgi:hypothetical protein